MHEEGASDAKIDSKSQGSLERPHSGHSHQMVVWMRPRERPTRMDHGADQWPWPPRREALMSPDLEAREGDLQRVL